MAKINKDGDTYTDKDGGETDIDKDGDTYMQESDLRTHTKSVIDQIIFDDKQRRSREADGQLDKEAEKAARVAEMKTFADVVNASEQISFYERKAQDAETASVALEMERKRREHERYLDELQAKRLAMKEEAAMQVKHAAMKEKAERQRLFEQKQAAERKRLQQQIESERLRAEEIRKEATERQRLQQKEESERLRAVEELQKKVSERLKQQVSEQQLKQQEESLQKEEQAKRLRLQQEEDKAPMYTIETKESHDSAFSNISHQSGSSKRSHEELQMVGRPETNVLKRNHEDSASGSYSYHSAQDGEDEDSGDLESPNKIHYIGPKDDDDDDDYSLGAMLEEENKISKAKKQQEESPPPDPPTTPQRVTFHPGSGSGSAGEASRRSARKPKPRQRYEPSK
jgi:hypothetical protein